MSPTSDGPSNSLGFVVWKSDLAAVESLLDGGVPVDAWGGQGDLRSVTPLMEAADELEDFFDPTRTQILRRLIAAGADVERQDHDGRTALHYASAAGGTAVAILIAAGAPVDATDHSGRTPLHEAVDRGCVSCIVALCGANADTSIGDANGRLAVDYVDNSYTTDERALLLPLLTS